MACQIPLKFGLPSAVRGALYFGAAAGAAAGGRTTGLAGAVCANDGDAIIPCMITTRMMATYLPEARIHILPFGSSASSSWFRRGGFFCRRSPFPAGSGKVQNRFHLHLRGARRVRFFHDRPGAQHFMANLEIPHVLSPLKPEHQWRRRGKRRRSCYGWPLATSPVRNAEFAVRGFCHTTDRNEVIPAIHRLGVKRGSIRDTGNAHPLGGRPGLP